MEELKVERLDHLGIVSEVIKDLGIVEMIDCRIFPDEQEEITTGEAIAGMILNGLGFSNRPMTLTPQFFENKPLDILFREGIEASYFNRFKLGRSLDDVFTYDCTSLFSEISFSVCKQESIDLCFNHLDTTSISVTGDYLPDPNSDEKTIILKHGYSKDHRPDLKQAVLEMIVSQDGGIPFFSKAWDGNASDNNIFKERSEKIIEQFKESETPRYLVADSKLYIKDNAGNLAQVAFITRIHGNIKLEREVIDKAWDEDQWESIDENSRFQCFYITHYGIRQRWLVVYSDAAFQRAEKTIEKAKNREYEKVGKQLFHLQAERFESEEAAGNALEKVVAGLKYHKLDNSKLIRHIKYSKPGKPTADTQVKAVLYQIKADVIADPDKLIKEQKRKTCFIVGTNIKYTELSDKEVIEGYKGQDKVERGFRFIKDPFFFTSSFFVTKPSRVQALLMVMTLALLVYSVAQRRLRKALQEQRETIPNQINQPTSTPTLRWVFQLFEGIHRVKIYMEGEYKTIIDGLTDLRKKILMLFGQKVCQTYQIFTT